ncbi:MAG: hypothetical protein LBK58_06360 [Prevotellaceae bacterium]|nr:hypothetical protein [Prevotellaceae bacterium]
MKGKEPEKEQQQETSPGSEIKRTHRIAFMLNDTELGIIEQYLQKYRITNRSSWYRRTILSHIWKVMEEDYPTLFNENEMRR